LTHSPVALIHSPAAMVADVKRFTAVLIWLITFGVCYLGGASEGARVMIPTALVLVFLLSSRDKVDS
jgi:hypothetical protein